MPPLGVAIGACAIAGLLGGWLGYAICWIADDRWSRAASGICPVCARWVIDPLDRRIGDVGQADLEHEGPPQPDGRSRRN